MDASMPAVLDPDEMRHSAFDKDGTMNPLSRRANPNSPRYFHNNSMLLGIFDK